jgi:hypothetical protein
MEALALELPLAICSSLHGNCFAVVTTNGRKMDKGKYGEII